MSLNLAGETGQQYLIQRSTDLLHWKTIPTVTALNGTAAFQDNYADQRAFYRAVLVQ